MNIEEMPIHTYMGEARGCRDRKSENIGEEGKIGFLGTVWTVAG